MKLKLATFAAALAAATGAHAADLGHPAPAAVDYVKVCDAYGVGFFYIPGTETCLKIDGYVRADYRYGDSDRATRFSVPPVYIGGLGGDRTRNDIYSRARALLHLDARTNTEFGLLRSYVEAYWTTNTGDAGAVATSLDLAYVQWGGLTAGRAQSFYDFQTGYAYGMLYHSIWSDYKTNLLAYTFSFGNGVSASISIEDPTSNTRRKGTTTDFFTNFGFSYDGYKLPDVVGQLRIAQAWGTAQLTAAAHHLYGQAEFAGKAGVFNKDDWGYAVGAGVEVNLPMLGAGDKAFLQANYSDGALSYACANCGAVQVGTIPGFINFVPFGDAAIAAGGALKTTTAWSVSGGFKHNFSPAWEFNIDGGYADVDGYTSRRDFSQWEAAADLRWKPAAGLTIGAALEYRSIDFSSATSNYWGLKDGSAWMAGLRIQRTF